MQPALLSVSQCRTRGGALLLQAWYAVHPPRRGQCWAFTRPYVHQVR
jgi:hypothetical protein